MGNEPDKNENENDKKGEIRTTQQEEDDDFYILEEINKLSLKGNRSYLYYWVDPKIFNNENMKYSTYLRKSIDIKGFSSIEGMYNDLAEEASDRKIKLICAASLQDEDYQKLQNDPSIPNMFLFCQNQERAKLLMINFPKIKVARFDVNELKDAILQAEVMESESDPKTKILFMIEDDTNLLNKYRLNYHCLTSKKSLKRARDDYVKFVTQLYP